MGPGQLFFGNSTGFAARAIEGWRMSWIYSANTGQPMTISTFTGGFGAVGVNSLYANGRPDVVGDFDLRDGEVEWGADIGGAELGGGYLGDFMQVEDPQCVNVADFTDAMGWNFRDEGNCDLLAIADSSGQIVLQNAQPGTRPNLGLNTLEGPGEWSLDASLSKEFQITEDKLFQIRIDATNIFNHATPDDPLLNINDTDIPWGFIEEKGGQPRNFQAQLRLQF